MEYFIFEYIWAIAVLPKTIQFAVLVVIALCLKMQSVHRFSIRKDIFANTILATNVIFSFAIVASLIMNTHQLSRVLAAINTCIITYIAIMFYSRYRYIEIDLLKVSKYMFINMLILFGLYVFYKIVGLAGNFPFMNRVLCGPDWVYGVYELRFRGYLEYTNLVVYMYLYCFPISLLYAKQKLKKIGCVFYELLSLFPIIATNSRTGIVCAVFLVGMTIIFFNMQVVFKIYKNNKKILFIAMIFMGIIILGCFNMKIVNGISKILSARQGSTDTRVQIYVASLTKMWTESPIWGCGIKDYFGGFPYGSHSTYIGMFYKNGIWGGCIYLIGMGISILRLFMEKENNSVSLVCKIGYVCVFALSIFEDLDGSNWNIVMFMTLFSVLFGQKNINLMGEKYE